MLLQRHLPPHCFALPSVKTHSRAHATEFERDLFAVAMLAEYRESILAHGPCAYRQLFWETGVIGQVLYLEAEASGVRGTGIGCFFDELTERTFGITGERFQVLYHFAMGGPVEDARLLSCAADRGGLRRYLSLSTSTHRCGLQNRERPASCVLRPLAREREVAKLRYLAERV